MPRIRTLVERKEGLQPLPTGRRRKSELPNQEEANETQKPNQMKEVPTKETYVKTMELIASPSFKSLMENLEPKEAIITTLKLGEYFSSEVIANLLGISEEEIIQTTTKVLKKAKQELTGSIDQSKASFTQEPPMQYSKK